MVELKQDDSLAVAIKGKKEDKENKKLHSKKKKDKQKEEEGKTPVIDPVIDWFGSIFSFCGSGNTGCCAGDNKDTKINQAQEMEWKGSNKIEPEKLAFRNKIADAM
jgi:hypothetical protein